MTELQSKYDDVLFMCGYVLGKVTAHDPAQRETLSAALRSEVWALGDVNYQRARKTIADGLTSGATIAQKVG
jgi:hypothetical protein